MLITESAPKPREMQNEAKYNVRQSYLKEGKSGYK